LAVPICLVLPARLKDRRSSPVKNIFVGNLDSAATDSSVRSLFEQFGAVERVHLVTDRETGRPRGFGFVEMSNTDQADKAIVGLNGLSFEGRALNVNEARPKTMGDSRSNGGGFGRERRESRW
jgi:cold-inducible RNA-binding protein